LTTGRTNTKGFTLIELLVVIAIIAILAAILFPVFAKARAKARQASCVSNMKQMTMGIIQYADDHDGYGPSHGPCGRLPDIRWLTRMGGYMPEGDSSIWACPEGYAGYYLPKYRGGPNCPAPAYQPALWRVYAPRHPEKVMMVGEAGGSAGTPALFIYPRAGSLPAHASLNNVGFVDGHVKGLTPGAMEADQSWFSYEY